MIIVVSGAPRSGTSLMMQILAAGGVPVLTDGIRHADPDNERGYFEWEPVKRLPREPGLIQQAEGKAVKIVSSLLPSLPREFRYKVLFLRRPVDDVLASQATMIARKGAQGASLPPEALRRALSAHLAQILAYIDKRTDFATVSVDYDALIEQPRRQCETIAAFLGMAPDIDAMVAAVDASLRHHRFQA